MNFKAMYFNSAGVVKLPSLTHIFMSMNQQILKDKREEDNFSFSVDMGDSMLRLGHDFVE